MNNTMNNKDKNIWNDPLSVLVWFYDIAILIMMFPSNSVIVFFRKRLGFRLMKPWVMGLVFFGLLFFVKLSQDFAPYHPARTAYSQSAYAQQAYGYGGQRPGYGASPPGKAPEEPLAEFALAMGALAFYHRRRGWKHIFDKADPLHTMARGDSYIYMVARWVLPFRFLTEYRVQRYIEPLICIVLGIQFSSVGGPAGPLGVWLILSGGSLAAIEALIMEKSINNMLDRHDIGIEAAAINAIDNAKAEATANNSAPVVVKKIGGVTLSPEMQRLEAQRRAKRSTQAVINEPDARQSVSI